MNAVTPSLNTRQHILDTAQVIIGGKGFAAVGLNEVLRAANVPKGSFYHYFASKEAFGEALLNAYFAEYLDSLEALLSTPDVSHAQRFMGYWEHWLESQAACDPQSQCLAVKLAAEVSDLSEPMRNALQRGTEAIVSRLAQALEAAVREGSLIPFDDATAMATTLYHLWLGASLRAKITRDRAPLEAALVATRRLLGAG